MKSYVLCRMVMVPITLLTLTIPNQPNFYILYRLSCFCSTLCLKNDTDVAHYNISRDFDNFGRYVTKKISN